MLAGVSAHVAHIASEAAIDAVGSAIRIDLRPVFTCNWGWLVLSCSRLILGSAFHASNSMHCSLGVNSNCSV